MEHASEYPRDMVGHWRTPPHAHWPGGARIALSLAFNNECGGETNILHGDATSEGVLNDIGAAAVPGRRILSVEQVFEFGSRVGAVALPADHARFRRSRKVSGDQHGDRAHTRDRGGGS